VLALRHLLTLALVVTVALSLAGHALAQEAAADTAKVSLDKGIQLFKDQNYKEAKTALLAADRDKLAKDDLKTLDEYLAKVDPAIRNQQADLEAFNNAEKAVKDQKWTTAREGYAKAAASEYLQPAMKKTAQAQLAMVDDRIKKASTPVAVTPVKPVDVAPPAATAKPVLSPAPVAVVVPQPTPRPLAQVPAESITPEQSAILNRVAFERNLRQQKLDIEFNKQMALADEYLKAPKSTADFTAASDAVRAANNTVENNRTVLTDKQYRDYKRRVDAQLTFITNTQNGWEEQAVIRQKHEMDQKAREKEFAAKKEKDAEIERRVQAAVVMIKQYDFAGALKMTNEILNMDPRNKWALDNQLILQQYATVRGEAKANDIRIVEEQKQFVGIREAEIPWDEIVKHPANWLEITKSRERFTPTATVESEGDRATRQLLQRPLLGVDFQELQFQKAIQWLTDSTGANITVNWTALEAAGINKDALVTLHLKNVKFETVLRQLLDVAGGVTPLGYVIEDGVIKISTKEDLAKNTITRTYDINDLMVRVPNFAAPELDLNSTSSCNSGGNSGGGLFGGGSSSSSNGSSSSNNGGEENIPTKSEIVQKLITMISTSVDPDSWREPLGSGTVGSISEIQGQLVITQTQENHARIAELISRLREAQAMQISIEARFIAVSSGFLESIGLDLNVYFNLGSSLGGNLVRDPATGAVVQPQPDSDPFTGVFVPNTSTPSGWGPGFPGSNKFTPIGVVQNTSGFTNMIGQGTGVGTEVTAPSLSIGGSFLDDIQVDFLVQATQASSYTRTLTAPRITLFNGQRAFVQVITEQAYISGYTPVVSENVSGNQPQVSFIPSGSSLDVEGTISADRRYVTLTVRPEVTRLVQLINVPINTGGAAGGAGSNTAFIQLPIVAIQRLETTVTVPDRGTLLLGGQRLASQIEREQGVPILSKIPIINRLFTNRGMVRDEQTLLILIKPTIIIQRETEEAAFPGMNQ